jgi:hypothetical protein
MTDNTSAQQHGDEECVDCRQYDFILIIAGILEQNTPSVLLYDVDTADLDFVAKSIRDESSPD